MNRNIFRYGFRKTNDLQAESIKFIDNKMRFNIMYGSKSYKAETYLLGKHNVYNILSAISVSLYLGISISQAIASLKTFYGASRRFDVYKDISINGYNPVIIDDYGHHPTEIDSTIQTINKIYKKKKLL